MRREKEDFRQLYEKIDTIIKKYDRSDLPPRCKTI